MAIVTERIQDFLCGQGTSRSEFVGKNRASFSMPNENGLRGAVWSGPVWIDVSVLVASEENSASATNALNVATVLETTC